MLMGCTHCRARVNATKRGEVKTYVSASECIRVSLLECPVCAHAVVAQNELVQEGQFDEPDRWSATARVWPEPDTDIPASIPSSTRISLIEANLCLRAGAFTASVVMIGRALEARCHHFGAGVRHKTMAQGLKELLDREIIDKRLFEWSEALRIHRNLAAYASGEQFSHEDAEDLFNFATAICDYVFVLNEKFALFMKRNEERKTSPTETALL